MLDDICIELTDFSELVGAPLLNVMLVLHHDVAPSRHSPAATRPRLTRPPRKTAQADPRIASAAAARLGHAGSVTVLSLRPSAIATAAPAASASSPAEA